MNARFPRSAVSSPRPPRGFSLVVALVLSVLLGMLVVGMLSLSSLSLRSAARNEATERARQNARLALQLALGELQLLAGPDQRITARAQAAGDGEVPQPQLTGVWEGWKWDGNGSAPNWQEEKERRFQGWLLSSPDPRAAREPSFAQAPVQGDAALLVPASQERAGEQVSAPVVAINRSRSAGDGYAWAVFDESQKASVSLEETETKTFAQQYDHFASAAELPFLPVKSFQWQALGDYAGDRGKLLSLPQLQLIGLSEEDRSFHDLTSGTTGLLTNAAEGGWARDLSRLFDQPTLPPDYERRFLYSDATTPLVPPPSRFQGANPLPSPDPAWSLLHSHYRLFDQLTEGSDGRPQITAEVSKSDQSRPDAGTAAAALPHHYAFTHQAIAPVIAKAQFVFSLAFGYQAETLPQMYNSGGARRTPEAERDKYIAWLVIDPVITLWNPYNVRMSFSSGRIALYRIPLSFRIYKNGTLISDQYTKLTDAHTTGDFPDRANKYYRLNLLPETGQDAIVLEPGEHIVLTAHPPHARRPHVFYHRAGHAAGVPSAGRGQQQR